MRAPEHFRDVFLNGGTGYVGSRLGCLLAQRSHRVRVLVRPASVSKVPAGCDPVIGDALRDDYASQIGTADTFVHLVGVSHPSPSKAEQFHSIDLRSLRNAVDAFRS